MKKLYGFSLMEMMVVLLIISIVAAASAPMINKKMVGAAADKSPWVWSNATNIAYNLGGKNQTATVGATTAPNTANNARIYIDAKGGVPHVSFGSNRANPMNFFASKDFLLFSNKINSSTGLENTVALGPNSDAVKNSVSVGVGTKASDSGGVALGHNVEAGSAAVAIGYGTNNSNYIMKASGSHSIAVGSYNQATEEDSIAVGQFCEASGKKSIAIGKYVKSKHEGSIVIGNGKYKNIAAESRGPFSIAIGSNDQNSSPYNTAASEKGIAIGYSANAGTSAVAIGSDAGAGPSAVAIGIEADADTSTIAIGEKASTEAATTNVTSNRAIAIGEEARASRDNSIAIGGIYTKTSADGSSSTSKTKSTANRAIAIGAGANAGGINAIAIGTSTLSKKNNSVAIGQGAEATHENSVALGLNATTTNNNQIVLGNSDTVVYIPGKLVVYGHSLLGSARGAETIINLKDVNKTDGGDTYYKSLGTYTSSDEDNLRGHKNYATIRDNEYTSANSIANTYFYTTGATPEVKPLSDRRLKNVGKAFKGGLEEIKKLETFHYTFKKDPNKTPRVGVMAQDLQKIFPEAVFKGEDGFLRIRMEDMFYAVINAIKELDLKLTAHDKKIEELTKQNQELIKTIEKLEKRLEKLEKNK